MTAKKLKYVFVWAFYELERERQLRELILAIMDKGKKVCITIQEEG